MAVLVELVGAASLLLWGLRMVRTGVLRAFGSRLNACLSRVAGNRFSGFLCGLAATLLLQSSSATALLTSSFAARGMLGAGRALAVMLGADVGTALVAQAYGFRADWVSPLLVFAGYLMFTTCAEPRLRDLGRAMVGLGIALLGLTLIAIAAAPLRNAPLSPAVVALISNAPVIGMLIGAALTALSSSSLAVILLTVSLVTHGIVPVDLAYALVLGANLGSGIMPVVATLGAPPEARRVPAGNLLFRIAGVALALPLLPSVMPWLAAIQAEGWRQVLNFHLAFNLGLAVLFIGFVGPVAGLTAKLFPEPSQPVDPSKPLYLNRYDGRDFSVGLANAGREALRMGDILARMLDTSLQALLTGDRGLAGTVSELDTQIDRLNEAIKLYLTRISRDAIDEAGQKRITDLVGFITSLEHAADIVDRSLMELTAKKIKYHLRFSPEGAAEIEEIHRRLNANVDLAMNVFLTGDLALARRLFAEKQMFRELERVAAANHLKRLREGRTESVATSGLHLDMLRDLKCINSHLTLIAQPRLEQAGELHPSRLKAALAG